MSAISDYAARVKESFDEISGAVDTLVESNTAIGNTVTGLTSDIAQLKATIDKLQNNPGPISPEDQETLNTGERQANALAARIKEVAAIQKTQADALKALDDATTPEELPVP